MGYVIIDNAYCLVGEAGGIPHSFYSSEEDFPNESIVSIVSYYGFLEPAFGINYTEWKSGELSYMPSEPAYTITFTEISA